jgi:hypothetical protein
MTVHLQGVRNRVSKSIQMQAIASEWFWSSVTTTALKKLAKSPSGPEAAKLK